MDIGCGIGTWLTVFHEYGVKDYLGVDGSWAREAGLLIPESSFEGLDINESLSAKNSIIEKRTFDLCVSLEVAEHICEDNAQTFITLLCSLSDLVLFSAAIPFQGGNNHVNEQWPVYWIKLFDKHGYAVTDSLRKLFWENTNIAPWYRQNILLFGRRNSQSERYLNTCTTYMENMFQHSGIQSIVNPDFYIECHKYYQSIKYLQKKMHSLPFSAYLKIMLALMRHKIDDMFRLLVL